MTAVSEPAPELAALKARQKATWESGDFGRIAIYNEPAAADFMSRRGIGCGARVLDVACGTGNLAVLAARSGAVVSGVDIAANLIQQARARAARLGLPIEFVEGDAERLPFGDATFDFVVSMFGVMFAPRADVAAMELTRVTKPGGVIALANWTPDGFIGKMFDVFARFLPPAPGIASPLMWGNETIVRSRLSRGIAEVRCARRLARLEYPFPVAETVEFFRKYYGPTGRAFEALDASRQAELRGALERLQADFNVSDDPRRTATDAEYLEIVAVRAG